MTGSLSLNAMQSAVTTAMATLTLTARATVTASGRVGEGDPIRNVLDSAKELSKAARLAVSAELTPDEVQKFANFLASSDGMYKLDGFAESSRVRNLLKAVLPENQANAYAFLTFLATILALAFTLMTADKAITPEQVEQIVHEVVQQVDVQQHAVVDPEVKKGHEH